MKSIYINNSIKSLLIIIISLSTNLIFSQISGSISFSYNDITFQNDTYINDSIYIRIKMKNLRNLDSIGKPELPFKSLKFIIPYDMEVDNIYISSISNETININNQIYPAQPPIFNSSSFTNPEFVDPVSKIYESNIIFPLQILSVTNYGFFDGVNKIVSINIFPIQYQPLLNKLIFHSNINFTLNLKPSNDKSYVIPCSKSGKTQQLYDNILSHMVYNPEYNKISIQNSFKCYTFEIITFITGL